MCARACGGRVTYTGSSKASPGGGGLNQYRLVPWRALRVVAEPGGAAAFAALLSGAYRPVAGERVAVIISGGNTAAVNFDLTR